MSTKLISEFISLGHLLSEQVDAAGQLWTWLPSHKVAEKHHGDYAMEFCPSVKDVLVEAAMYIGHMKHPERALGLDEQDWFTRCPCGEEHVGA